MQEFRILYGSRISTYNSASYLCFLQTLMEQLRNKRMKNPILLKMNNIRFYQTVEAQIIITCAQFEYISRIYFRNGSNMLNVGIQTMKQNL
ncbi:hypothetical protein HZS_7192 [Henneguya salminicola]|nr:hypothetical protein HZS_7192 [Henneguya salminicola]